MMWFQLFLYLFALPPCPADMVRVPGTMRTCIDRYEWPNVQGVRPRADLSATKPFGGLPSNTLTALCESKGKRTCTDVEWVASCEGPGGARYPWGDELPTFVPGRTNPKTTPCNYAQPYLKPDLQLVAKRDVKELARLYQADRSGTRGCVSASGAEDMMGNVEEWVRCEGPYGWCLAGRFWSEPRTCGRMVTTHVGHWHYYETGGRCCLDP